MEYATLENWKRKPVRLQVKSLPREPQMPGVSTGLGTVDRAAVPD